MTPEDYHPYEQFQFFKEDFDVLASYYEGDWETYNEALETFELDYQLPYSTLTCVFMLRDFFFFVNKDNEDCSIYGFCDDTWDLLILGEDWGVAFRTFEAFMQCLKPPHAFIMATLENRRKWKEGWRPSPLPEGGKYE
jgi:hypothetical protein